MAIGLPHVTISFFPEVMFLVVHQASHALTICQNQPYHPSNVINPRDEGAVLGGQERSPLLRLNVVPGLVLFRCVKCCV